MNYKLKLLSILLAGVTGCILAGCNEDPVKEDTPEMITKVNLRFTSVGGSAPIVVSATDPDGEGVQPIMVDGSIDLLPNTTYVLYVELINGLVTPGQPGYDLTTEVEEEGDEHQFFFEWHFACPDGSGPCPDLFSNPTGNGNIDNAADPVNYSGGTNSLDANGLNLGLTTLWTTASGQSGGFGIVLKHQPGTKTATSGVSVGETDVDLTFEITVQ